MILSRQEQAHLPIEMGGPLSCRRSRYVPSKKIKTLVHNEYEKGSHSVIWDGDDENCKQIL